MHTSLPWKRLLAALLLALPLERAETAPGT